MIRLGPVIAIAALSLSGCAGLGVPLEQRNPAPSSSYAKDRVRIDAELWAMTAPGRHWSEVQPTGSMVPLMDSRSVPLYETYTGQPLHIGDWVMVDSAGKIRLHRVDAVTATHVLISGVNSHWSDGWFPKTAIKLRVAGVLYSEAAQ